MITLKKLSSILLLTLVLGFGISQLTQPVYASSCPYRACDEFDILGPALGICFVGGQTALFYKVSYNNYCYSTEFEFPPIP